MGPGGGGASTSADPVDDAQQRFRSSVLGALSSRSKSLGLSRFDAETPGFAVVNLGLFRGRDLETPVGTQTRSSLTWRSG